MDKAVEASRFSNLHTTETRMNETQTPTNSAACDRYAAVQQATRAHRASHGCWAYTFEDGPSLHRLAARWNAHRVLELGTALGYTACCLAGSGPEVRVDTIERDAMHVALAREQIAAVGLADRITVHHGSFEVVMKNLTPCYDLAFFDGFTPEPHVIHALRQLLVDGGILVCANVELALSAEASALRQSLDDPLQWQQEASIEAGATRVLMKRGSR